MANRPPPKAKATPIVSAVLDDGTLVETVYKPAERETSFLTYKGGVVAELSAIDAPGLGRLVPYSASNNLLTHRVILFPEEAVECGSDTEVLAQVRQFIHRYADLSDAFEEIASHYVLLTWLYDAFSELPYLRLKGDFGSGKSRCLQTIGSICYKPMFASGASTVSPLFRMLDALGGTLVLDESDFRFSDERAEITKILNCGNTQGFPVLRSEVTPTKEFNPTAFHVFGPKIIATRGVFDDPALESRCITEVMRGTPPRIDIPLSLPKRFHTEATAIRNRLLMYRFQRWRSDRTIEMERDPHLEPRIAQVFAPLLSLAADTPTRNRLHRCAQVKSGDLAAERSASVEAQLLDIISQMERERVPLGVKEIAERFAGRFASDYPSPVTPRWIGAQLRKRLSLVPVKSHGTFVIPSSEQPKLQPLYQRYGLGEVDVGDF